LAKELVATGYAALGAGRWTEARDAFESALAAGETGEACIGLATALWWLGESRPSVTHATRAYALFRQAGAVDSAVECAVWLGITYKANFANFAAANGWLGRAERLLEPLEPGSLHGWANVARAYRMADLATAETLARRAAELARTADDVDLELSALSQLGLIRVGQGSIDDGFALIDEAIAAALGGERANLDTVVYTCCDMLNACELAGDLERAAQWCRVADDFVDRYGCPFLYAECRIYYGSVLSAKGRWIDADRELNAGLQITEDACPGLYARALTRLAALRVRQGRLEDAARLLSGVGVEGDAETTLSLALLLLAREDAGGADRRLSQRLEQLAENRIHLAAALDLLVDARLGTDDVEGASNAAERLSELAARAGSRGLDALSSGARGRVSTARGDTEAAAAELEAALAAWTALEQPYETARTRLELGRAFAATADDAGVEHLRRALADFEQLGASLDRDRVAAMLRSVGVTARTGAQDTGPLTGREKEVLQLLAAGLSNPEIAERLFISRKTASHHVSHILAKLNLRNRAEAAAYATTVTRK
jgi:DNA-binding NarL/FixJ family response regulator